MTKRIMTPAAAAPTYDVEKFENVHQVGGIRTARLDFPGLGGDAKGGRVALVDTGSGLRFTVALDRGGDIVDAFYNLHSLTYLTPNGLMAPSQAHNTGLDWLLGWAGGLVTTCGPQHIGGPRIEDGIQTSLHGRYSNLPAAVDSLVNPDPHAGRHEMSISLLVRDSRMFGPVIEVHRKIQCALGQSEITISDHVINRGNQRQPHNWLYHVNLGYPLLDEGARFIYRGPAEYWQAPPPPGQTSVLRRISDAEMNRIKRAAGPLPEHVGAGERGLIIDVEPDRGGLCHAGLINERLELGLELEYPADALPRLANWQHFGPRGSYVAGVEPFSGSLMGKAVDKHPKAEPFLEPGETRSYRLTFRVLADPAAIERLAAFDGPVKGK